MLIQCNWSKRFRYITSRSCSNSGRPRFLAPLAINLRSVLFVNRRANLISLYGYIIPVSYVINLQRMRFTHKQKTG